MSNRVFLINTSNYIASSNSYQYVFPNGHQLPLTNSSIAICSASIYNSFFNIKSQWKKNSTWKNNYFIIFYDYFNIANIPSSFECGTSYTDPITNVTTNKKYVKIVIPDGYYDISRLDLFLQQQCVQLGFYFQSTSPNNTDNMYFMNFETNPTLYKAQINVYIIPHNLPSNFVIPSLNTFSLPPTDKTPMIYLPSVPSDSPYGSIADIFGFNQNTFLPSAILSTSVELLSTKAPTVSPITNIIFTCNMVRNIYATPNNLFFQLPITVAFGAVISYNSVPVYVSTCDSHYQYINIKLFDQYNNELDLVDKDFTITISITQNLIK